jgi:RNA polymerase sigma-70 factor (ECF subfamily)
MICPPFHGFLPAEWDGAYKLMETFEEVYNRYVEQIFRFVLQRVGRHDVAEDITSETFLKLHKNWEHIDQSQLPNWLFTVARNDMYGYWRHKAVEKRFLEPVREESLAPAHESAGWLFDSKMLKPVHRVCLVLRYVHDMDRDEIARRTGLSENQVKSYLQYARELLRKQLGASHG